MSIIWSIWLPISSSLRTSGPISAIPAKSTPPPEFILLTPSRLRWIPNAEALQPPPIDICRPNPAGPQAPMPIPILEPHCIPGSAIPGTIPGSIPAEETLRFVGKLSMNILARTMFAPTCCSYAFTTDGLAVQGPSVPQVDMQKAAVQQLEVVVRHHGAVVPEAAMVQLWALVPQGKAHLGGLVEQPEVLPGDLVVKDQEALPPGDLVVKEQEEQEVHLGDLVVKEQEVHLDDLVAKGQEVHLGDLVVEPEAVPLRGGGGAAIFNGAGWSKERRVDFVLS
ncbi:hypothetical protein MTO96_032933 [Rhipicephalus appendiculatus]